MCVLDLFQLDDDLEVQYTTRLASNLTRSNTHTLVNGMELVYFNLFQKMSCKLKLEDIAYFSHEHPRNTVRHLLTGQGRWSSPVNSRIEMMEAEVILHFSLSY